MTTVVPSTSRTFSVRPYCAADAPRVKRLYASVADPYRPEDADAVGEKQRRALRAEETGQRWSPLMTDEPYAGEHAHLAFWVAIAMDSPDTEVIGTVGLRKVGDEATARTDTAESSGFTSD